jgi:rhamnosyltransferase
MSVIDGSISNAPPVIATPRAGQVCAICVTHHPDSHLPERLSKVLRQVTHLVIVDNGSSPAALRMLGNIAHGEHVTLIPCKENFGIARGLNVGVEYAVNQGYDYALLLDQDTSVNEDLVSALTRIHQLHPDNERLAVVGAGYAGSQQAPTNAIDAALGCVEVESVIASGSLLWLKSFKEIGPFRDEFFIDYVDTEYCARARRKGYLVVQAQQPLMVHVIGSPVQHRFLWMTKSTRNHSADRLYYQARNDTVMLRESGKYHAGMWSVKAFGRACRQCKRVILFESHKASKVVSVLQGWRDGVRGRLGQRHSTR